MTAERQELLQFLRENGSEKIQEKLSEKGGENFCLSYLEEQIKESNVNQDIALGWLEQLLNEV